MSFGCCLRFDLAWVEMKLTHGSKPSQVELWGQPLCEEPRELERGMANSNQFGEMESRGGLRHEQMEEACFLKIGV